MTRLSLAIRSAWLREDRKLYLVDRPTMLLLMGPFRCIDFVSIELAEIVVSQ